MHWCRALGPGVWVKVRSLASGVSSGRDVRFGGVNRVAVAFRCQAGWCFRWLVGCWWCCLAGSFESLALFAHRGLNRTQVLFWILPGLPGPPRCRGHRATATALCGRRFVFGDPRVRAGKKVFRRACILGYCRASLRAAEEGNVSAAWVALVGSLMVLRFTSMCSRTKSSLMG